MLRFALVYLVTTAAAFTPPGSSRTFATFGNEQTKTLIKAWSPKPLKVPNGAVLLPGASTENFKRYARARILLEDQSTGCVASFDDSKLCLFLTKFTGAEHRLILPLWSPECDSRHVFADLMRWHGEFFSSNPEGARLSGAHLESDREAWTDAFDI